MNGAAVRAAASSSSVKPRRDQLETRARQARDLAATPLHSRLRPQREALAAGALRATPRQVYRAMMPT